MKKKKNNPTRNGISKLLEFLRGRGVGRNAVVMVLMGSLLILSSMPWGTRSWWQINSLLLGFLHNLEGKAKEEGTVGEFASGFSFKWPQGLPQSVGALSAARNSSDSSTLLHSQPLPHLSVPSWSTVLLAVLIWHKKRTLTYCLVRDQSPFDPLFHYES